MKVINFYMQAVWMVITGLILSSSLYDADILFLMLYVQLFLGINQYLFSLIFVCLPSFRSTLGIIHFSLSTITLIGFIAFKDYFDENESLSLAIFFGIPWSLAILYWIMSFKIYIDEKDRYSGRFRFLR